MKLMRDELKGLEIKMPVVVKAKVLRRKKGRRRRAKGLRESSGPLERLESAKSGTILKGGGGNDG